ncbi:cytochrome P450 monooxygenase [Aspergillus pseudodeflectus]|uniref:Cytochrome P450 monooxygenase n=1 Tax=Aspergillus pseudodeflectus TaxID=176178 RepID=A0ABR4L5L8_9EURO
MATVLSTIIEVLSQSALLTLYATIAIPLIILITDYIDGWRKRRKLGSIPVVDEGSNLCRLLRWNSRPFDPEKEYRAAYEKYSKNGIPYAAKIQHDDYAIALPPGTAREWRAMGHEQLSVLHALSEFADLWPHMNVVLRTPVEAVHSCNNEFTLKKFQASLAAETEKHLHPVFSPRGDHEWTEFNTLQAVFSATSAIATSLILGADHADAAEITAVSMGHNDGIMLSRVVRSAYPRILRPLVWCFAPTCRELQSNAARLRKLMIPEINCRVERVRSGKTPSTAEETSFSLLDVLIEATFKNGTLSRTKRKENEDELVDIIFQQLLLYHFELSRPTGMNVVFMLYTIMNNREYIAPLRDEWAAAVNRCGGDWTQDILSHAPKLESFSKETFRYHDVSYFVGLRRVMQPLHLTSLNLRLKEGTLIMTPCRAVHHDPEIYSDPSTFNGFRFYDAATNTCTPKAFTTSPSFLTFSHGSGTCPARILATQIARMVFGQILHAYDVELAHENMPEYSRMDPSGAIYFPNPEVNMRVRRRGEEGKGGAGGVDDGANGSI